MEFSKLQYISQSQNLKDLKEELSRIVDYGIDWIQLRVKNYGQLSSDKFEGFYEECGELTSRVLESYNTTLIINDNIRLCMHLDADGVHLGKKDTSLEVARDRLKNKYIGATANKLIDIENAIKQGADYIGLGPLRETDTKKDLSPVLGFDGYEKIMKSGFQIPIYAIGGITELDFESLSKIGLYGMAISGLIYRNGSSEMVKEINDIFTRK